MINNLLLIFWLIFTSLAHAQNYPTESFADYLFGEGEYYRAVTEYYRMLHSTSNAEERFLLWRKIGLCYIEGEDYDGFISFYKKNKHNFTAKSVLDAEMKLNLGKSYYHLDRYRQAISSLDSSRLSPNNHFFNASQLLLGISYSRNYEWQSSIKELQLINQNNSLNDKIIADNLIRSFQNGPNLTYRNPTLAGGMSAILPGAGYAYCHRWGTAVASLIVNGLIVWTFSDAMKNQQYGFASLTGFVGIGWYIGNIRGSVKAAKKYNTRVRDDFIDSVLLRENLLEYVKK